MGRTNDDLRWDRAYRQAAVITVAGRDAGNSGGLRIRHIRTMTKCEVRGPICFGRDVDAVPNCSAVAASSEGEEVIRKNHFLLNSSSLCIVWMMVR